MKSAGMPFAMWLLFEKSFKQNLTAVFGMSGKKKFTPKDMNGTKQTAALRWLPSETRLRVNRNDIKTGAHLILAKEKGQGNSLDLV